MTQKSSNTLGRLLARELDSKELESVGGAYNAPTLTLTGMEADDVDHDHR